MKIKNISKLPKRKVTMEELLGKEEIKDVFDDVLDERDKTEEVLFIWGNGKYIQWRSSGLSISRQIYIMEMVKYTLMKEE